ncbi:DUF2520 domain-containing protein [Microbacterium sp. NPDC058389]|uniref:DUF2520 domain-containing protein n=1 Tax=Microbacterium sp. NPDC058389 TaxID=3346475 RepID=UPI00364A46AA
MPDLDSDAARARDVHRVGIVAIVGDGRIGRALAASLRAAGVEVQGPLGRGATAEGADVVLLTVPDAEIGTAAASVVRGPVVGHVSGATTLAPLAPHEAFGLHPLLTVTGPGAEFVGVPAAIAGSTDRARASAHALAGALGLRAFELDDDDRAAYHAAASIASNFLVTLEAFAADLAATAGIPRDALVPLVRATVSNWETAGSAALTGPIARGDDETVARQRAAVAARMPRRAPLFDALTEATRDLVRSTPGTPA